MQTSRKKERTASTAARCCSLESCLDAKLFKALADPMRLQILLRVAQSRGPQSVGTVAAGADVDLSVVSRHLAALRDAGVLSAEKQGRSTLYRVRYSELARTLRLLADCIDACCPD